MKNSSGGLISRLGVAKKRISEFEVISRNFPKLKGKKKNRMKKRKQTDYPKTVGQLQKYHICTMVMPREETKEQKKMLMK